MFRVAVVEDEPLSCKAMVLALRSEGFTAHGASDAYACRALMEAEDIDLVVLDLGLPGLDGLTFARELRGRGKVGLVIVTRRSEPEARIAALDLGADDYLVKPVHLGELAARLRSVLRRTHPYRGRRRRVGPWIVDLDARTVSAGEVGASLTRGEFDILAKLVEAEAKIVSRQDLASIVSRNPEDADLRSVDALVSRLRRKLDGPGDESLIVTAPGFGYRLGEASEEA